MGETCPQCNGYRAVKRTITADGKGATRARDVLARELSCGHIVGGEKYEKFMRTVAEIKKATHERIVAVEAEGQEKLAAAAKAYLITQGGK